jgi:hypothetical protein
MEEDKESERSYDGSDANLYYEMKEDRKERKRKLLETRNKKEKALEFEKEKVDEVNAAYISFKKARQQAKKNSKTIPIDFTVGRSYKLYSTEHVELLYNDSIYPTKRVDFHYLDECDGVPLLADRGERKHGSRVARIKKRRVELSRKLAKVCP